MLISEAVGEAMRDGDIQAVAAAVLAHLESVTLPRQAILAIARVAFGGQSSLDDDDLVRAMAAHVIGMELAA